MSEFDTYKHLDEEPMEINISMDELAVKVASMNYGTHRFLCALTKAQENKFPESELAKGLRELCSKHVI
jgi:hypothetical protein